MVNRLKYLIKTPWVEKSGVMVANSSDNDLVEIIDSLIMTLEHYKKMILHPEMLVENDVILKVKDNANVE